MNKINIKEIIQSGETETVEFKKPTGEWKEIIKTLSGFANTRGGVVLIGVDKKGKVCGISIGKNTVEDITNKIVTNTEPKLYPEINVKTLEKKRLS